MKSGQNGSLCSGSSVSASDWSDWRGLFLEGSRRNAIEPTLPAFLKVTTALHSQEIKSLCSTSTYS